MRRLHGAGFALCLSCAFAAGCANFTRTPERLPEADRIAVYDGIPQDPRPYRLVKRIWVETWQSAIMVPTYRSSAEGAADLQNQAARLGGDAIMDFDCYDFAASFWRKSGPGLVCNGNVIKYVP